VSWEKGETKRKRKREYREEYKRRVWTHLCKIAAKELINL